MRYEGGLKNNKRHGKGKLTFTDGTKFSGSFENGKICGKGTFTLTDGTRFEDEFSDDDTLCDEYTFTLPSGEHISTN